MEIFAIANEHDSISRGRITSLRFILLASDHHMGQKNGQSSYLKVGVGDKVWSGKFQKPLQFSGWLLDRQLPTYTTDWVPSPSG